MDRKWDVRFLELANHISSWSRDPSTKIGAVIVDDNRIVRGMGYNGFPRGVNDDPERYANRDTKLKFMVHAERNAIDNSEGSLEGCTIYVYPSLMNPVCCHDCAKSIIQNGIKRVVGFKATTTDRWKDSADTAKIMLLEAGVEISMIDYITDPFEKYLASK